MNNDDFSEWVAPHWTAMRRLAIRLVGLTNAEDVLQEALLRAWRRHETFDPTRGAPRAWLLAILADRAKHQRRYRPEPLDGTDALEESEGKRYLEPDIDLERAIAVLPARQYLAVNLYYFVDLPISTVAEVMGIAPGTVRATLVAARSHLRNSLKER